MAMELVLPELYPTQIEFCKAEGKEICFGGSVGGGKSHVARVKMILLAYEYPGIQMLLLRRTFRELRTNHVIPLLEILRCNNSDRNKRFAEYRDSKNEFIFPNGSRIILGYCDSVKAVSIYQGNSYDVIFMEEATLFEEEIYSYLTSRNRLSGFIKKPFQPRMYFTCNPGGVGHTWVKNKFINNPLANKEGSGIVMIRSRVYDNKYLMENDPEYIRKLELLPPKQKAAFLDGDWDVFEGQFFEEFDRDIHVIDPFPIPKNWRVYRARDYGFDMLAVVWVAIDEQGFAYVYKELYEPGLIISLAGEKINEINNGDNIWLDLAPPDLFARNRVDSRSTVDIFQEECGHFLTRASSDRVNGWNAMREWLGLKPYKEFYYDEDGVYREREVMKPRLRIFRNCTNLIRCIPQLQFNPKNPNDASTEPHEITHINDACRYFCASWSYAPNGAVYEKPKSWVEQAIEEHYKKNKVRGNGGYIEW